MNSALVAKIQKSSRDKKHVWFFYETPSKELIKATKSKCVKNGIKIQIDCESHDYYSSEEERRKKSGTNEPSWSMIASTQFFLGGSSSKHYIAHYIWQNQEVTEQEWLQVIEDGLFMEYEIVFKIMMNMMNMNPCTRNMILLKSR
jgi:hypothetical protein